jgi:hypothetical protein
VSNVSIDDCPGTPGGAGPSIISLVMVARDYKRSRPSNGSLEGKSFVNGGLPALEFVQQSRLDMCMERQLLYGLHQFDM